MSRIEELLNQLKSVHATDAVAFPYADCRRVQQSDSRCSALISDLDVYISELAGYRSWAKRILAWPDEKIEAVHRRTKESFFDRFPAYSEIQAQITSTNVPDLYATLNRAEQTRAALGELLSLLQHERASSTR